ncbi:MAG: ATP-binding cassette domain-containing protein [Clostridia bacterium]|nr:ATP-binding cassette domain-containing protein [Clostridia bacterium]MBQ4289873.1 ATP-binding cassette domain-containing protein [Clostridia bacterium]
MIKIEHLVKQFGEIRAVDDISFEVKEGEVVGFLGPNGAGKTTTMNMITGYLSSTSGSAVIDGIDILDQPLEAKRRIGFLPEQPPLYLDMTVEEYLNFIYDLKGCTLNRRKHLMEICEVVRIVEVYRRIIRNLSKGYRQRVGIAQALVGNPKVIIFDEPTVGLDPKQIVEIRTLIRTLGRNHTVILSTHILPEASAVCERIVVINKGKLIANEKTEDMAKVVDGNRRLSVRIAGPTDAVLRTVRATQGIAHAELIGHKEGDAHTYLIESEPGVDSRRPLFYSLAQSDFPILGEESMGTNLEDVFLALLDKNDERKRLKREAVTKAGNTKIIDRTGK